MIPNQARVYVIAGTPDPLPTLLRRVEAERHPRGWHDHPDTLMLAVYRDNGGNLYGWDVPCSVGMQANPLQELPILLPRIARDPQLRAGYATIFTPQFYGWLLMIETWAVTFPTVAGLSVVVTRPSENADRVEARMGHLVAVDGQEMSIYRARDADPRVLDPTVPGATDALGAGAQVLRRFTTLGARIAKQHHPDVAGA